MREIDIVILEKGRFNFIDKIIEDLNKNTDEVNFKKVSTTGFFNQLDVNGLISSIEIIIGNHYLDAMICAGLWDLVKSSLIFIWKNVQDKKMAIIKGNEIKENEDISLSFKIGNLDFKMPNDFSDDLKEKFIDNAFELSKQYYNEKGKHIVFYDKESDSFKIKEYNELLREIAKEKMNS
ncbi:hypothetical protein [Clostridium baratii]|uniref:hypothetical protein n=1 Tax=Clostridium baratii TaxID=1561 RepID=UPI001CAED588|nr:hypothetical protein [Clostridium baratii]STB71357.1 Uncharacterised protein [Clostridium baratii]